MATDRSTVEGIETAGSGLDNMLKEQYLAKGLQDVRPDFTVLMSTVPFVGGSEKAGSELVWPVVTSREHGFTALGANGENINLSRATKARTAQARVQSFPFMGRTQIDNVSISRAKQGPQAFVNALEYKISNLQESFVILNEQELLYGKSGLGQVAVESTVAPIIPKPLKKAATQAGLATAVAANSVTVVAGEWVEILLDEGEFADHVWIGSEDMELEADAVKVRVESYDIEARKLVCEVLTGGVLDEGEALHRNGFKGQVGAGLQYLFSNTSLTGTGIGGGLLGIDQTKNPLWRVNQAANTGLLSFEKVADAVAKAVGRGLAEKLTLHVHPLVFASLMPDFNTLKDSGSSYKSRIFTTSSEVKKMEHGVYGITFIVGSVEVVLVANPFIKIGHAFGVADGELMRCGSTDITYKIPGEEQEKYFHRLPDIAGLELRVFSDQALFSVTLNKHLHMSGITLS
jgi:hypothetical protein